MFDVVIIGGGLSGLISAHILALNHLSVAVIEKNTYPFHRVCGEYISNEVKPFLEQLECFPQHIKPSSITKLEITSPSGFTLRSTLGLGGFGISRYAYDHFLKEKAIEAGATIIEGEQISSVQKEENYLISRSQSHQSYKSTLVIGAQGKRSLLDKSLHRSFMQQRSPYIGVKYHVIVDQPSDLISLHNFSNGYCGISKIEKDRYCLCYLTSRDNLRRYHNIQKMEEGILFQNPALKKIFTQGQFLYDTPEVINEISFAPKTLFENNILFCGDAAGMIAPLCGNGMSMAIHGAKLLSECIIKHYDGSTNIVNLIAQEYQGMWNTQFQKRLWMGRNLQKLFGQNQITELSLRGLSLSPALVNYLIRKTHGKVISC